MRDYPAFLGRRESMVGPFLMVAMVALVILQRFDLVGGPWFAAGCMAGAAGFVALGLERVRESRRERRRLIAARYRVCFRCGYDLSALAEDGVCPECGEVYLGAALRERWAGAGFVSRAGQRASPPPAGGDQSSDPSCSLTSTRPRTGSGSN